MYGGVPVSAAPVSDAGEACGVSVPAAAVCDNGLFHRGRQSVPEVPAVTDLDRLGCGLADGLGVRGRSVTADDFDTRVLPQPPGEGVGPAIGQYIDPAMGYRVQLQRRIAVSTA
jgi:hypothetical protein